MNAPDEESRPEDEPEVSDAELREQFEEFGRRLQSAREDGAEMLRLSEELVPFVQKYRERLAKARLSSDGHLNRLLEAAATLRKSQKDVEQKEEDLLQASADVAESQGALTEQIIEVVHIIHSKWDELDYAQREQFGEVIEDYMDSREDYLASLPIEDRLRLEKLYPKWW